MVEWLERGCYLWVCFVFIFKFKGSGLGRLLRRTENVVNIVFAKEMENIFLRIKSGNYVN